MYVYIYVYYECINTLLVYPPDDPRRPEGKRRVETC